MEYIILTILLSFLLIYTVSSIFSIKGNFVSADREDHWLANCMLTSDKTDIDIFDILKLCIKYKKLIKYRNYKVYRVFGNNFKWRGVKEGNIILVESLKTLNKGELLVLCVSNKLLLREFDGFNVGFDPIYREYTYVGDKVVQITTEFLESKASVEVIGKVKYY